MGQYDDFDFDKWCHEVDVFWPDSGNFLNLSLSDEVAAWEERLEQRARREERQWIARRKYQEDYRNRNQ